MFALAVSIGVLALVVILNYSRQNKELKAELKASKERFAITYDLLWMQVRDKNDLTFEAMAGLIVTMQKSDMMPAVKETLAKRITGETNTRKQIGF